MTFVRKPRDLLAGAALLAFGVSTVAIASQYPFGTAARMGPGFFPTVLGALLCLVAIVIAGRSLIGQAEMIDRASLQSLKAPFFICAAMLSFGILLRPLGIVAAILVSVLLSTLAAPGYGWKPALATAVSLAMGSALVFVVLLRLPIPILGYALQF